MTLNIKCTKCDGNGFHVSPWDFEKGKMITCNACSGVGSFEDLSERKNVETILALVISTRGKSKGKLKSSFSSYAKKGATNIEIQRHTRAYYIWRMARFHGGADYTMPFTAGMITRDEPQIKMLDAIADEMALKTFGTHTRAARRWAAAGLI